MKKEDLFSSRDLYLASALVSLKFKLLKIDFQIEGSANRPVGYFYFANTPALEDAVKRYWNSELACEIRSFINEMRGLKSQVTTAYKAPY
jgi:hypothetical protein